MTDYAAQSREALSELIVRAGGTGPLADQLTERGFKAKRQNVEYWRDRALKGVPAEAVPILVDLYPDMTAHRLRGDIFRTARVPNEGKVPRRGNGP